MGRVMIWRLILRDKSRVYFDAEGKETDEVTDRWEDRPIVWTVGDPWPGTTGKPDEMKVTDVKGNHTTQRVPLKIGAIFYRPAATGGESWVEQEDDEDAEVKKGEKPPTVDINISEGWSTSHHYEVWGLPDEGSFLDQTNETRCIEVGYDDVKYAEKTWPYSEAKGVVQARFQELGLGPSPGDEEDEEDEPSGGSGRPVQTAPPS